MTGPYGDTWRITTVASDSCRPPVHVSNAGVRLHRARIAFRKTSAHWSGMAHRIWLPAFGCWSIVSVPPSFCARRFRLLSPLRRLAPPRPIPLSVTSTVNMPLATLIANAIRQVHDGRSLMDPAVTTRLLDGLRNPVQPDPKTVKNYVSGLLGNSVWNAAPKPAVFGAHLRPPSGKRNSGRAGEHAASDRIGGSVSRTAIS